jgi:hypothetical protein
MAARWMDDGGWQNDDEYPPPRGRRAARRARNAAANFEDDAELDSVFDDAEFEQLFGDLQLGPEDWFARRAAPAPPPRAPAPPPRAPAPRFGGAHEPAARHEPAAARLDRQDSGDSVARAAARLDRDREQAPHARAANSELQRLHRIARPEEARAREPERWGDSFMEQPADCGICLKKKPLRKFALAPCGHGWCRQCVRKMEEAKRNRCPFCRSHVHTYCRAKHWPHAEHLDRLLASQAAMNPYTI